MKGCVALRKGVTYNSGMNQEAAYRALVDALAEHFGDRLRMIVLFGSRSRDEARADSDHDIFLVIEGLQEDPLQRQREIMKALLPHLTKVPERVSLLAKTPAELEEDITPLLMDVFTDGRPLYGEAYFSNMQKRMNQALAQAGLERRLVAGTWMWVFPAPRKGDWELTWEGYREVLERS